MQFKALESLRGVAALMVALYHSAFLFGERSLVLENSALFVDFFFILSGFVMTYAYRDRIAEGLGFTEFAFLRLGRLFPLHAAVLLMWVPLILIRFQTGFGGEGYALLHSRESFLLNFALLNSFGLQPYLSWNYPSWSIGAEIFAYLGFFLAVAIFGRRLNAPTALIISASFYMALAYYGQTTLQKTFDFGILRCLGGFFLGVSFFAVHDRIGPNRVFGTGAEIVVVAATLLLLTRQPGVVLNQLATFLAFGLLVLVFARSNGGISALLTLRLPTYLGRISYSVYLVHALVFTVFMELAQSIWALPQVWVISGSGVPRLFLLTPFAPLINAVVLLLVILISAQTYRWIEKPFRKASRAVVKKRVLSSVRQMQ